MGAGWFRSQDQPDAPHRRPAIGQRSSAGGRGDLFRSLDALRFAMYMNGLGA